MADVGSLILLRILTSEVSGSAHWKAGQSKKMGPSVLSRSDLPFRQRDSFIYQIEGRTKSIFSLLQRRAN
jgi:hypothetical protein